MDFGEIRIFPGEELDDLDAGKELLEQFGTLVGKNHGFLAETKEEAHEFDLDRCNEEEDGETSQSTRAQVYQKDDQTDDQLDRSGPTHVEETGGEVDTRNVGGDVVNQFSVGVDMPGTSGESESLVVDCGDQSCAQQDTGARGPVEKVVHSERCQGLEEEETERETDTFFDRWGRLSGTVGDVGTLSKSNESLTKR